MLDHGILNVPLGKRGNIDREIDRWKAEQKMLKRQQAQASAQLVTWARLKIHAAPLDSLAALGKPHKLTALQTRKYLLGMRPSIVLRMHF